jgi:hypothetical protein
METIYATRHSYLKIIKVFTCFVNFAFPVVFLEVVFFSRGVELVHGEGWPVEHVAIFWGDFVGEKGMQIELPS